MHQITWHFTQSRRYITSTQRQIQYVKMAKFYIHLGQTWAKNNILFDNSSVYYSVIPANGRLVCLDRQLP